MPKKKAPKKLTPTEKLEAEIDRLRDIVSVRGQEALTAENAISNGARRLQRLVEIVRYEKAVAKAELVPYIKARGRPAPPVKQLTNEAFLLGYERAMERMDATLRMVFDDDLITRNPGPFRANRYTPQLGD